MLAKRYPLLGDSLPGEMLIDLSGSRIIGRDKHYPRFAQELTIGNVLSGHVLHLSIHFANLPNYLTADGMTWRLNPISVVGTPYEEDVQSMIRSRDE